MKTRRWPFNIFLVSVLALGAGCSVAPIELYQLQNGTGEIHKQQEGAVLLLGPIKLADYLQREQILQRQSDGRLTVSNQGLWAGNLQDEVGQLLLRSLTKNTGNSRIALYPDRVGVNQQAQIILSISRLDSGVEQPAVLEAQWRLLDSEGVMRDSRIVRLQAEHDGQLVAQIQAQSELLERLAKQLATAVEAWVTLQAAEKTDNNRPVQVTKPDKNPATLTGTPMELEVYRF